MKCDKKFAKNCQKVAKNDVFANFGISADFDRNFGRNFGFGRKLKFLLFYFAHARSICTSSVRKTFFNSELFYIHMYLCKYFSLMVLNRNERFWNWWSHCGKSYKESIKNIICLDEIRWLALTKSTVVNEI